MHPAGQPYPIDKTFTDASGVLQLLGTATLTVYKAGTTTAVISAMPIASANSRVRGSFTPLTTAQTAAQTGTVAYGAFVVGEYYKPIITVQLLNVLNAPIGLLTGDLPTFRLLPAEVTAGYQQVTSASPTEAQIAASVRTNLAVELARLDVNVSSRSTLTDTQAASAVRTNLTTELGRIDATVSSRSILTAAGVRTELGTELGRIDAAVSSRSTLTAAQVRTNLAPELANMDAKVSQVPAAVRTNLTAELAFLDVSVSSRNSTASYVAGTQMLLDKASLIQAKTDNLPTHPASTEDFDTEIWQRIIDGERDFAYLTKVQLTRNIGKQNLGKYNPTTNTKDTEFLDQQDEVFFIVRRTFDPETMPPDLMAVRIACHPITEESMNDLDS